ncbi:hypothetical protein PR048_005102 [Dryococelus australis]|uniref:Uncharacterized protein n=1 Tax=Dryococelus australis TaxID=614101 RepID=A0ABQ9I853_9NEOP|nr:hypothetical protein PR048_005102 [Dryococelus australis]
MVVNNSYAFSEDNSTCLQLIGCQSVSCPIMGLLFYFRRIPDISQTQWCSACVDFSLPPSQLWYGRMGSVDIFHSDQIAWKQKHTKILRRPAFVLKQEDKMCYEILQDNGVVAMRHVDQLQKLYQKNEEIHTYTSVETHTDRPFTTAKSKEISSS